MKQQEPQKCHEVAIPSKSGLVLRVRFRVRVRARSRVILGSGDLWG